MYLVTLVLGILVSAGIVLVSFIDWYYVIEKIATLMFPGNPITDKDILSNREKRKNPQYRAHKKKWLLRSLTTPLVNAAAYVISYFIFKEIFIAFAVALVISVVCFEIIVSYSKKDKKV